MKLYKLEKNFCLGSIAPALSDRLHRIASVESVSPRGVMRQGDREGSRVINV
jgi:hypothetical protein